MVANKEGQWNPKLFEYRDKKYGYNSDKTIGERESLSYPTPTGNCDSFQWQG